MESDHLNIVVFTIAEGRLQHDNNWRLPFKLTQVEFQPDDDIALLRRKLADTLRAQEVDLIIYKVRTLVFRMYKVLNWH